MWGRGVGTAWVGEGAARVRDCCGVGEVGDTGIGEGAAIGTRLKEGGYYREAAGLGGKEEGFGGGSGCWEKEKRKGERKRRKE